MVAGGRAAARRAGGRAGVRGGGQVDRGRVARGRYLPGTAALLGMAWHRRAKIGGAADPATSPVSSPGRRHVILLPRHATMHGAAQAFRRAIAIGAAKSVSFEKKTVLDLKLVYKKY